MVSWSMESKKVVAIVAAVVLCVAFALLMVGEWMPSIGYVGLLRPLCSAAGFVLFGISFVCVALMMAASSHQRKAGARVDFGATVVKLVREALRFAVSCAAYVGSAFVALAVIVAFGEGAPTPDRLLKLVVVLAACVGVAVLYRRYRKKHPVSYDMLGAAGIVALFALLTLGAFAVGASLAKDVVADALHGPRTELCWLAEVDENRATGRYSSLSQDKIDMTFKTFDEREIHISVAENDRPGLSDIVDAEGVVWLTYFPESGVYLSAEPGIDDYRAVGGE
ncbi:MAG: hypothetical protein Q4B35_02125 [Slackia sp.]|nr:hypothetical protein [Slackia sp.]